MRLKETKTCWMCRASENDCGFACRLGFKVDSNGRPMEPCLKPVTYTELIEAEKERNKR